MLTIDEVVERARAVHKDLYDYSEAVYTRYCDNITIRCSIHGPFEQTASNHIELAHGCPHCAKYAKMDTTRYLFMANRIHKGKYSYPNFTYKGPQELINIVCPLHGKLVVSASKHLYHRWGCTHVDCLRSNKRTENAFINMSKLLYNNKYGYKKTKYTISTNYVTLTCPHHSDFSVRANQHVHHGTECRSCKSEYRSLINSFPRLTEDEFLYQVSMIHNHKYTYDEFVYFGNERSKVRCEKHGLFMVSPKRHLYDAVGCKKCEKEEFACLK